MLDFEMGARIGPMFGRRRHPRVRYVKGTRKLTWCVHCMHKTRRAAFRCARERRDKKLEGGRVLAYRVARRAIRTKKGELRWRWAVLSRLNAQPKRLHWRRSKRGQGHGL